MDYISIDNFEGPLDLLLHLVNKELLPKLLLLYKKYSIIYKVVKNIVIFVTK